MLLDSYANAFNFDSSEATEHMEDVRNPPMTNATFEGKYELDSLAAFLKLSRSVYAQSETLFDDDEDYLLWLKAVDRVVETIMRQQMSTSEEEESREGAAYTFERLTSTSTDTLMQSGKGAPCARTNMSKCQFRPSDDATTFPFLVPANAMAVVELREMVNVIVSQMGRGKSGPNVERVYKLIDDLTLLAESIHQGIETFGKITHPLTGKVVFAYEVDGYGNFVFMDDANIPSLLSCRTSAT